MVILQLCRCKFSDKKLCSTRRLYSIEIEFSSKQKQKIAFKPPFGNETEKKRLAVGRHALVSGCPEHITFGVTPPFQTDRQTIGSDKRHRGNLFIYLFIIVWLNKIVYYIMAKACVYLCHQCHHHHHSFVHKTHTHWRQKTRQWNRATTQYANCWPTQSMQLLSNICNKIN